MGIFKKYKKIQSKITAKIRGFFAKKSIKKPRSKRLKKTVPQEISHELQISEPKKIPQIPHQNPIWALEEFSNVQLSEHTQRAYKKDLQDFFVFLKINNLWECWQSDVGPIQIAQYRDYLHKLKGLSKTSTTRKLAVLKSFYKWALARAWVEYNPTELIKGFPQTQDSKTGFLNESEIDQILEYFEQLGADLELSLSQQLSKVVTLTLLMLGIRRGEAARIRLGDFELSDNSWLVRIQGKGDRERKLPLPDILLNAWCLWCQRLQLDAPESDIHENPSPWLIFFQKHAKQFLFISSRSRSFENALALSTAEIARIVRKHSRKAGIVNRVSPHMLRASAITHALDNGASHRGVQQMAGWTSPLMITRYDKRRNDPKISAIHNLKYAQKQNVQKKNIPESLSSEIEDPITERDDIARL